MNGFCFCSALRRLLILLAAVFMSMTSFADIIRPIDIFSSRKSHDIRAQWQPGVTEAMVSSTGIEAERLRRMLNISVDGHGDPAFPCLFGGTGLDRMYWDRPAKLDLRDFHELELELSCGRPDAIRTVGLYLKSGRGWYVWLDPLNRAGRRTIRFPISAASTEGRPAGWDRIDAVRISFTQALAEDTEVVIHSMRARVCDVVVVEGTVSVAAAAERGMARSVARRLSHWLADLGVSHALISDEDVVAGKLRSARVAVLPYNPLPTEAQMAEFSALIRRGGRLIVFYSLSPALADLMQVRLGEYMVEKEPGEWSSFSFNEHAPEHLPKTVFQESRNIRPVYPDDSSAKVIANWRNAGADPAWVQSDRGFWMSHVLLDGDVQNKKRMMLGLLGFCEESVWISAARHAMENIGRVGVYRNFKEAVSGIARSAAAGPQEPQVRSLLAQAERRLGALRSAWSRRDYGEVISLSDAVRNNLVNAYAMAQGPAAGEFRGVWNHSGTGLYPGDWNRTCGLLAKSGVNALFPNVLWPGRAHYPSRLVAPSAEFRSLGDQLKQCLSAAAAHGIQVHAWKVCWNLGHAQESWVKSLEKQGRLQRTAAGKTLNWLCPSDPDNVALELNAIMEIAENYGVDGIHLDYIRYPAGNACYCAGCKRRFERRLGRTAAGWPESAATGGLSGEYASWRAGRITEFVRLTRESLRRARKDVKLSVAVYPMYPGCIDSVGQDWGRWLAEGLVDFVLPMNYAPDTASFRDMLERQLALPAAAGRVFPGIGATATESRLAADQVIDQIGVARSAGAGGFILFDLNRTLEHDILPVLSLGVTRPDPP